MSLGSALRSTKLLFSYVLPLKAKLFRNAIVNDDLNSIKQLVTSKPILLSEAIDTSGNTPLGLALLLNRVDVVEVLIGFGSDPNVANVFNSDHPLMVLARSSSEDNRQMPLLVNMLLNAGTDALTEVPPQVDAASYANTTKTPLWNDTPLLCCVRFQNVDLLKLLIENQVDINFVTSDTATSPLMLAAMFGYVDICNVLLDAGADINAINYEGNTSLHLAVHGFGDKVAVIRTLLERGADPAISNEEGYTPAMLAKEIDDDECFNLLNRAVSEQQENPSPNRPTTQSTQHDETERTFFSFT